MFAGRQYSFHTHQGSWFEYTEQLGAATIQWWIKRLLVMNQFSCVHHKVGLTQPTRPSDEERGLKCQYFLWSFVIQYSEGRDRCIQSPKDGINNQKQRTLTRLMTTCFHDGFNRRLIRLITKPMMAVKTLMVYLRCGWSNNHWVNLNLATLS